MLKFLILSLFSITLLFATNPKPYSQLGDDIYNSLGAYKKLGKSLPQFNSSVNDFIHNAKSTKKLGFMAEADPKLSQNYLFTLRELDAERESILTRLNSLLYKSMDNKDTKLFSKLIRSHFIDLDKVAEDIIPFYKKNFKLGSIREIDTLLKDKKRYQRDKKAENVEYLKRVEQQRINRMRDAGKSIDSSLEESLDRDAEAQRQKISNTMQNNLIR
jgi:hypothetical protein